MGKHRSFSCRLFSISLATMLAVSAKADPVVIPKSPASQSVFEGQSASFGVEATGTAPLTYRWAKNDIPLLSGTNYKNYSISSTNFSDAGDYRVLVTKATSGTVSFLPNGLLSAKQGLFVSSDRTLKKINNLYLSFNYRITYFYLSILSLKNLRSP